MRCKWQFAFSRTTEQPRSHPCHITTVCYGNHHTFNIIHLQRATYFANFIIADSHILDLDVHFARHTLLSIATLSNVKLVKKNKIHILYIIYNVNFIIPSVLYSLLWWYLLVLQCWPPGILFTKLIYVINSLISFHW